jgi:hypothetical protein
MHNGDMTGRESTLKSGAAGWRAAAGFLLVLEAMWWAANLVFIGAGVFGQSTTAELLSIVPVALMFLTLLAVFLVIQAPLGGVWMGLGLQAVIGLHAFVLLVFFASLVGALELAMGLVAALLLAAAATEISRHRD